MLNILFWIAGTWEWMLVKSRSYVILGLSRNCYLVRLKPWSLLGMKLVNLIVLFPVWWYSSVFHYHSFGFAVELKYFCIFFLFLFWFEYQIHQILQEGRVVFDHRQISCDTPIIPDIKVKKNISSNDLNNYFKEVWYSKNLSMKFL